MEEPLVSIICACYNQSEFVIESLESVKNQIYKNVEIIIWDDCSKDDSVSKIEQWIGENKDLKITFVKNKVNKGICKSLNECFRLSSGKYLQLLALDDILLPDKITRHVEILENSKENEALVFSDAFLIDNNSKLFQNKFISLHKHYYSLKTENYFDELLEGNFIPAMSILYKTSIFKTIGLWDEDLVFEDYDMLLRIAKEYDFIFDEITTVKYRLHENNTHKKKTIEMRLSYFKMLLKFQNYNDLVNLKLKNYIINKYKNYELMGEQVLYFKKMPPKTFQDRLIYKNKNIVLYSILESIPKIKRVIFKK